MTTPASVSTDRAEPVAAQGTPTSNRPPRPTSGAGRSWLLPGVVVLVLLTGLAILTASSTTPVAVPAVERNEGQLAEEQIAVDEVTMSEEQWRQRLTEEQFYVLRQEGTERPFSNKYHDNKAHGTYTCAGCGNELFSSETKFDSGTGWPSFYTPLASGSVRETMENGFFDRRTEVSCSRCGGHLGHVFDDGPPPTGLRYCMNSAAMLFLAENEPDSQAAEPTQ